MRGEEVDCALIAVDAHPVGLPWEVGDLELAALDDGSAVMTIDRSGLSTASQATSYPPPHSSATGGSSTSSSVWPISGARSARTDGGFVDADFVHVGLGSARRDLRLE